MEYEVADKHAHPPEYTSLEKFLLDQGRKRGTLLVLYLKDAIDLAEYDDGTELTKEDKEGLHKQVFDVLGILCRRSVCKYYHDSKSYKFR